MKLNISNVLGLGSLAASMLLAQLAVAEIIQIPVSRDLWISSAGGEEHGNNGGAPRLKLKGYQEFSILDFDLAPLRGKRVKSARLRVTLAGDERLYRVAVGTISEDWQEGSGRNYERVDGASSFARRIEPNEPWLLGSNLIASENESSDLTSVIFGEGGSIWAHADASEPEDGRQTIAVAPEVVASRLYGFSYGFVLFDDQGTELVRDGDKVDIRLFPNRFLYSREQNRATQPYLEVEYDEPNAKELANPVAPPSNIEFSNEGLPAGSVVVSWTQENCASSDVLGFRVTAEGAAVPLALTPRPALGASRGANAETQRFKMRLDNLPQNRAIEIGIVAVDSLGRESETTSVAVETSTTAYQDWKGVIGRAASKLAPNDSADVAELPTFAGVQVAILDEFVKLTEDGKTIPETSPSYLRRNAVWNAGKKQIELTAARNEFVGFQIALLGKTPNVRISLTWNEGAPEQESKIEWKRKTIPVTNFYRFAKVTTPRGKIADPMLLCDFSDRKATLKSDAFYCEIFTPIKAKPGKKFGKLTISNENGERLELELVLTVWNFALPNELSFLPEMNCYGLPENELEYYRLAQEHRVYINRVPYSHRGQVGAGLAPQWNSKLRAFDWTSWRARFERYFTGEAFADLPRGAIPIEAFYLPLFENFPADVFTGLDETKWPDKDAFSREYRETFRIGAQLFAKEILEQDWSKTRFLFFLNNKSDYKRNGWSNASSPWLLDEPASYRDFAALQYFGTEVKSALRNVKKRGADRTILFRADISRPQWERDSLEGILDLYVVPNDVNKRYRRMIDARHNRDGRLVMTYGETAPPHENGYHPVLWQLDAWSSGADGIVPWQTIGDDESWRNGDPLAIFYPACEASGGKVVPSMRLKAYRRGEQDVEYLKLLERATKRTREEIAQALRARLALDNASAARSSAEDAGVMKYNAATPNDLTLTRREIGGYLDRAAKTR